MHASLRNNTIDNADFSTYDKGSDFFTPFWSRALPPKESPSVVLDTNGSISRTNVFGNLFSPSTVLSHNIVKL